MPRCGYVYPDGGDLDLVSDPEFSSQPSRAPPIGLDLISDQAETHKREEEALLPWACAVFSVFFSLTNNTPAVMVAGCKRANAGATPGAGPSARTTRK